MSNCLNAFALVNSGGIRAQIDMQFAKMGNGESSTTLRLGPAARLFEKQSDGTYTFATSGAGIDAAGKEDGGLMDNDILEMAGHTFTGFRKASIGQKIHDDDERRPLL